MKKLFLILAIGWIAVILYQGSREVSQSYSYSNIIVDGALKVIQKLPEPFKIDESILMSASFRKNISILVRKSAHFLEYATLAIVLSFVFYSFKVSSLNRVIYSLFITLICAVSDEFYQSFIGRGSSVRDVVLDFFGALFGICCFVALLMIIRGFKAMIQTISGGLQKGYKNLSN